jgi:hypothetical protein
MRRRSREEADVAIVAVALGGLLLLLAGSLLAAKRRVQEIYSQLEAVNATHRQVEATLRRLRSDVNLSGILVRDYLLDTSPTAGPEYRAQLSNLRSQIGQSLGQLEMLVDTEEGRPRTRPEVEDRRLLEVFDPSLTGRPRRRAHGASASSGGRCCPRRDEVLRIAREIEGLNDASMQDQRAQVALRERELRGNLNRNPLGKPRARRAGGPGGRVPHPGARATVPGAARAHGGGGGGDAAAFAAAGERAGGRAAAAGAGAA